jgi:hypothetical protein
MARYTCTYLEMPSMEARAFTAGLLHNVGKLLLLHLHPFGFQAIVEYARDKRVPVSTAERYFLGVTTRELAADFAVARGLPRCFASVMRWVEKPTPERDDAELTAIVSLARLLCRHNRVGWSGGGTPDEIISFENTPEWEILRPRVFPSFNLQKFEAEAQAECRALKLELHGRWNVAVT